MSAFTIYEKHPTADAYRVGGFYSPYALVSTEKRFGDAELAAEYHQACFDYQIARDYKWMRGEMTEVELTAWDDRCEVIHRFASLPHFDA